MRSSRGIQGVATLVVAALVGALGAAIAGPEGRPAVWIGALAAGGFQAMIIIALPLWLGPSRRFLSYGLAMLARFAMFAAVALVALPLVSVPAAPLLFALVTVFFVTTLLEPLLPQTMESTVR